MIALRGRLARIDEKWTWRGEWVFSFGGAKALQFSYEFNRVVPADQVGIPSAGGDMFENEDRDQPMDSVEHNIKYGSASIQTDTESTSEQRTASISVDIVPSQSASTSSNPIVDNTMTCAVQPPPTQNPIEEEKGVDAETPSESPQIDQSPSTEGTVCRPNVTFADKQSPDDPNFTDASEANPDKCPPSGEWRGSFEAITGPKSKNEIVQIEEHFYLFLNSTPPVDATIRFLDEESISHVEAKLPDGHIHVRGAGENQYGVFELIGSFELETGILEVQRMYVKTPITPRRAGRRGRKPAGPTPASGETADGRPYSTRKRQLSWKRRAASEDSDNEASGAGGKRRTPSNSINMSASRPGRKRVRDDSVSGASVTEVSVSNMEQVVSASGEVPPTVKKAPPPSPRVETVTPPAPKKRVTTSVPVPHRSGTGSNNGSLKLPAAGEASKARWRAAHFLYYQRNDPPPIDEDSSGNGMSNTQSISISSTPKYVVYEGEMFDAQRDGMGVCLYNNGTLYEGRWQRDKEHGFGTLMTADRKHVIYTGEWEKGRIHGKGIYYYGDYRKGSKKSQEGMSRYEGDFKETLRNGTGTYFLPDGSVYRGLFRDNLFSGRGVFTWPDGSVYSGEFKDGKRHGLGLLKGSNGFSYDGAWVYNSMDGRGSATYPNGQQYNGLFSNGRREGRGTILFTNGASYEGRFKDDAIDGTSGTMKIGRTMTVPRLRNDGEGDDGNVESTGKEDFMIPVSFQSDMGHIHRKAGFTVSGK